MSRICQLLLSLIYSTIAFEHDLATEDSVLILNDSSIYEAVTSFPEGLLVKFYAPWCGHCKALAPKYALAAVELGRQSPPLYVAKVDAEQNTKSSNKYHIKSYPTLKFLLPNGKSIEYNGQREPKDIVEFVKRKSKPSVTPAFNVSHAHILRGQRDSAALFIGNMNDTGYGVFSTFCKMEEQTPCYILNDTESLGKYKVGEVLLITMHDSSLHTFGKELMSANDLSHFVSLYSVPAVAGFSEKVADKIFNKFEPGLILFHAEDDMQPVQTLKSVEKDLQGIQATYSTLDTNLGGRLGQYLSISKQDLPSVWIVQAEYKKAEIKKWRLKDSITNNNIKNFIGKWIKGEVEVELKSQPIPEQPYENNVRILVGKNFKEVVYDTSKDVLVEFYAPWCGHCQKLEPRYAEMATSLKHVETLVVAKIDATANDVENVEIKGFPTLYLFKAENNERKQMKQIQTTAEMIIWLQGNTHHTFVAPSEDL